MRRVILKSNVTINGRSYRAGDRLGEDLEPALLQSLIERGLAFDDNSAQPDPRNAERERAATQRTSHSREVAARFVGG